MLPLFFVVVFILSCHEFGNTHGRYLRHQHYRYYVNPGSYFNPYYHRPIGYIWDSCRTSSDCPPCHRCFYDLCTGYRVCRRVNGSTPKVTKPPVEQTTREIFTVAPTSSTEPTTTTSASTTTEETFTSNDYDDITTNEPTRDTEGPDDDGDDDEYDDNDDDDDVDVPPDDDDDDDVDVPPDDDDDDDVPPEYRARLIE